MPQEFFYKAITGIVEKTRDIFCLNYDTVIEASLEELQFSYTDGFRGSENAYFDSSLYDEFMCSYNLYKLHGSINWVREGDEVVRRKPTNSIKGSQQRYVIYPAEQKYIQTQYGVYETLLKCFRNKLRDGSPNKRLIVIGYSFSDEHINIAIEDSIKAEGSNLTVFALLSNSSVTLEKKFFLKIWRKVAKIVLMFS